MNTKLIQDPIDKCFKQYSKMITDSIQKLSTFTDNLDNKVNNMLKAQQTQFVTSYKSHMDNVRTQLKTMESKIQEYKQKILYYQNQGRLSNYIKKMNFLEQQQTKLLQTIAEKNKKIKQLKFQLDMQQKQQKFTDDKLKQLYRSRVQKEPQHDQDQTGHILKNCNYQSIQTFSTQLASHHYKFNSIQKVHLSKLTNSQQHLYHPNQSLQTQCLQKSSIDNKIIILQKQNHQLKIQNRKLMKDSSRYANGLSQLGEFFLKTVEEIKRTIQLKRKLNYVTYDQFRKEDKILLIATLLNNQAVLMLLYNKIFKPDMQKHRAQSVLQKSYQHNISTLTTKAKTIEQIMSNPQREVQIIDRFAFPSIKNKKIIY